ncbi:MAG: hypothetical protein IJI35_05600 [Kiritimatiellae bacterium]|nr:hypothetical protein [Kiritimatiellia bacterium]
MTATDELRALLDELGIEWDDGGEGLTIIPAQDLAPVAWTVNTWPSGKDMGDCLWVQNRHPLTPAQAIAATLGRGTCKMAHEDGNDTWWSCNECDADVYLPTRPKFCWNCGREVVDG